MRSGANVAFDMKRRRTNEGAGEGEMKSISVQYKGISHKMSWYDGATAEELEQVGTFPMLLPAQQLTLVALAHP